MRLDLASLQLVLLPGKFHRSSHFVGEYDLVYRFWKRFWERVYREQKSEDHFSYDDFTRQDIVGALLYRGNVVGALCHSFFDIDRLATRDHSYFDFFSQFFVDSLKSRGVRTVQSFEFLSMDPIWRRRNTNLAMAETLIGCGLEILQLSPADAAIAIARRDVSVHTKAHKMGYWSVEKNIFKRNFSCDTIACLKSGVKPHPERAVRETTEKLWMERINATRFEEMGSESSNNKFIKTM